MLGGDRADRLQVARQPAIVDADDRLRPRRDFRPEIGDRDVECAWVDVDEPDVSADVQKRDVGGSAGEDGGEYLVATLDTSKQESEMQRIGAGAHGHARALEAEARPERWFELLDLRTLPDPASVERVRHVRLRLTGDVRV